MFILLTIVFCTPYFYIGWHPIRPPATLPLTFLDRVIPFDPQWSYMYESLYLLIPLAPFLAATRRQLNGYISAFLLLTLLGLSICLFFPVRSPRAESGPSANFLYTIIATYDPPTNAFPSMHMALATQSLLFGAHLLRQTKAPRRLLWLSLGTLWLALIAYATLAIRQHYAFDLPAGIALAFLCHFIVFRSRA